MINHLYIRVDISVIKKKTKQKKELKNENRLFFVDYDTDKRDKTYSMMEDTSQKRLKKYGLMENKKNKYVKVKQKQPP